jgi:hypothetical protein
MVAAAINIAQTIQEVETGREFAERVDPGPMQAALEQGMLDTIREGPPFALGLDPQIGNVLQIEVLSYGLFVPYLGAPGQFTYEVRARIYDANGERVYSSSLECDTAAGDPSAVAVVTGTVNNIRQLRNMSDEELQRAFDDVAYYCGTWFATRMRKHAG